MSKCHHCKLFYVSLSGGFSPFYYALFTILCQFCMNFPFCDNKVGWYLILQVFLLFRPLFVSYKCVVEPTHLYFESTTSIVDDEFSFAGGWRISRGKKLNLGGFPKWRKECTSSTWTQHKSSPLLSLKIGPNTLWHLVRCQVAGLHGAPRRLWISATCFLLPSSLLSIV